MKTGHGTDVGRVRDHNEDNYCARPDLGLWVVADGMGGHAAGEVASAIAIEVIPAEIEAGRELTAAIEAAHAEIIKAGRDGRGASGMGCTVVALKSQGLDYEIAWVGDSRGYLRDGSDLKQLTRDHSYVQQLIDSGVLSEEDARVHPQRSVISQALGIGERGGIKVDRVTGRWAKGQQLLICSDGLTGEVDDAELARLLAAEGSEQEKVKQLIAAANRNGGSDNVTVVLISAPASAGPAIARGGTVPFNSAALNRRLAGSRKRSPWPWALAALILLVAVVVMMLVNREEPATSMAGGGGAASKVVPAASPGVLQQKQDSTATPPIPAAGPAAVTQGLDGNLQTGQPHPTGTQTPVVPGSRPTTAEVNHQGVPLPAEPGMPTLATPDLAKPAASVPVPVEQKFDALPQRGQDRTEPDSPLKSELGEKPKGQ